MAEADRDLTPEVVFRRTVQFGLSHYPEKSRQEHWLRFLEHMENKYSVNGYVKLWLPKSPNADNLNTIRRTIEHPEELRRHFERLYDEETSQTT